MLKIVWLALGIGYTVYCFMTHEPMWWCIANVVLDVTLVLSFLVDVKNGEAG